MREPRETVRDARTRVFLSVALGAAALAALLLGRLALSVFVGVVLVAAYVELHRSVTTAGDRVTLTLGALGVAGLLWCGYTGRLALLPIVVAVLTMALLVSRIVMHELLGPAEGVTEDLAATLGAAGAVGVLGAHIVLLRAMPGVGFRGVLVLALMVAVSRVTAYIVGRARARPTVGSVPVTQDSWQGAVAGVVASALVGIVVGIVVDPPFDLGSGLVFGVAVGVLAALGALVFATIDRGTRVATAARRSRPLEVLASTASMLFTAPPFYWAFRTIAL